MDSSYYLSLFLDEGRERLHHVAQLLVELEKNPHDIERVAQVFREVHSFKGNADTMGFTDVATLAHAMEHVLDGLRARALDADPAHMRLLARALVALELRLSEIGSDSPASDPPMGLIADLEAVAVRIIRPQVQEDVAFLAAETSVVRLSEHSQTYRLVVRLDPACLIRGMRAFMVTTALEQQGAVLDVTPSLEELDWPDAGDTFEVVVASDASPEALKDSLTDIGELAEVTIETQAPAPSIRPEALIRLSEAAQAVLREAQARNETALLVTVAFLPTCRMPAARAALTLNVLGELGEVLYAEPAPTPEESLLGRLLHAVIVTGAPMDALREAIFNVAEVLTVTIENYTLRGMSIAALPSPQASAPVEAIANESLGGAMSLRRARTVRIAADGFDDLLAIAERLQEANARLARLAHARSDGQGLLVEAAADAAALAASLVEQLDGLRRVPLEGVFNRFPRLVRELGGELGKQINLQILGAELEVDRALADELGEVLLHLVRNAVDHGLETPSERHAAGKATLGTLQLSARRETGHLVVTVSDDGRGIDPQAVAAVAVARGYLTPGQVEGMSDEALQALVFDSGLSTALTTTRISGRGVGLDAVREKVEALGGRLSLDSTPERGTVFALRFPARLEPVSAPSARIGA